MFRITRQETFRRRCLTAAALVEDDAPRTARVSDAAGDITSVAMRFQLTLDCHDPPALAGFWCGVLGYTQAAHAEPYVVLVPETGEGPHLVLQRVPEPKPGKNRMHIDITVDDLDTEVARVEALGAQRLSAEVVEEYGFRWVVMSDPEGNEFCVGMAPG